MENNLVQPHERFINRVLNSWSYLNPPITILNEALNSLYSQGCSTDELWNYLKKYNDPSTPRYVIENFLKWRRSISYDTFKKTNSAEYDLKNLPKAVKDVDDCITNFYNDESNYTYFPYTKIVQSTKDYPMKYPKFYD